MFTRQKKKNRVSSLERACCHGPLARGHDHGKAGSKRYTAKTHPGGGAKPGGGGIKPGGGGIPIGGMPGMPGGGANDCGACRLNSEENKKQSVDRFIGVQDLGGRSSGEGRELTLSAEPRDPFLVLPEHQIQVPERAESARERERRVSIGTKQWRYAGKTGDAGTHAWEALLVGCGRRSLD